MAKLSLLLTGIQGRFIGLLSRDFFVNAWNTMHQAEIFNLRITFINIGKGNIYHIHYKYHKYVTKHFLKKKMRFM